MCQCAVSSEQYVQPTFFKVTKPFVRIIGDLIKATDVLLVSRILNSRFVFSVIIVVRPARANGRETHPRYEICLNYIVFSLSLSLSRSVAFIFTPSVAPSSKFSWDEAQNGAGACEKSKQIHPAIRHAKFIENFIVVVRLIARFDYNFSRDKFAHIFRFGWSTAVDAAINVWFFFSFSLFLSLNWCEPFFIRRRLIRNSIFHSVFACVSLFFLLLLQCDALLACQPMWWHRKVGPLECLPFSCRSHRRFECFTCDFIYFFFGIFNERFPIKFPFMNTHPPTYTHSHKHTRTHTKARRTAHSHAYRHIS